MFLFCAIATFSSADMAKLFNIERYDGANPAVLTQIEDEGIKAVVAANIDNYTESFYDTETSKINTLQVGVGIYEVEGDWVYHASIHEAVSGTQSDPRDSQIDDIGIFIEDIRLSVAKIISRELSVGLSYELNRFGTYDKGGNTFLTGRQELWLSQLYQKFFAGATYQLSSDEHLGMVAGIDTFHSNHTTFGWRFFGGIGMTTYRISDINVELSTTLYPRQYTVGSTLASNFMPLYWSNELQIQADLNPLKVSLVLNYDVQESLEGIVITNGISNKIINRYELQVKKPVDANRDFVIFVAFEDAVQDELKESRLLAGISYALNFD